MILVLDEGDDANLEWLVPNNTKHTILVAYERIPNLKGRIFNQVSYLNLDRYSDAEYAVTIDSDCAFFRPVTPDTLFDSQGRLILISNRLFQKYDWNTNQKFFTGLDDTPYGQAMATQPVSFRLDSFLQYREFIHKKYGYCYERRVSKLIDQIRSGNLTTTWFCWMCQLGVFLEYKNVLGYDYVILDDPKNVYFRYGAHLSWEHVDGTRHAGGDIYRRFSASMNALIPQALCLWFGSKVFEGCEGEKSMYVRFMTITYASVPLIPHMNRELYERSIFEIKSRLKQIADRITQ